MTSRLSSAFHLLFLESVLTTDVMYTSMSLFCPCSSCRETERWIKGSRASLMSTSGRLVTHMRRFRVELSDLISSFKRFRTSERGDGMEGCVRTFIQSVYDQEDGGMSREFE